MQGFAGADPEQLDALAGRFSSAADELEKIRSTVAGNLGRTPWNGRDADQFRDTWRSRHSAAVSSACQVLRDAAKALRTNASDQRGASDGQGGTILGSNPGGSGTPPAPHAAPAAPADQVTGHREWQDVQKAYDAWATGGFAGDYKYQCTSYANFRWHELGYTGPPISGNGWAMAGNAPGDVSATPSLHSMASYGDASNYGHVMIVEEIRPDGTVRVSEMNAGNNGALVANPDEYRDQNTISRSADGKYYVRGQEVRFAAFPG